MKRWSDICPVGKARRGTLDVLVDEARSCTLCAPHLPHPPRPVLRLGSGARIVVIGQAPGAKVHASGIPWADDSGDHLIEWLDVERATFEDPDAFAIVPMGFCFPGSRAGGDLPPRPECAPEWHARLLGALPELKLRLLVGQYAQAHYLGDKQKESLTETVKSFEEYLPRILPLPHPSWRSRLWMTKNPWFAKKLLPVLRRRVKAALRTGV